MARSKAGREKASEQSATIPIEDSKNTLKRRSDLPPIDPKKYQMKIITVS